jgi:hypothetical protein
MIAVQGLQGLPMILAVGPQNFGDGRPGVPSCAIARAEGAE